MINPFKEINWSPDRDALRTFGVTSVIGFAALAALLFGIRWGLRHVPPEAAWPASLVLALVGGVFWLTTRVSAPAALALYRAWHFLAACIGIVVSNTLMLIFFYAVFSPFAVGIRLVTGRDPLRLRKPAAESYWILRKQAVDLSRYFKQY